MRMEHSGGISQYYQYYEQAVIRSPKIRGTVARTEHFCDALMILIIKKRCYKMMRTD